MSFYDEVSLGTEPEGSTVEASTKAFGELVPEERLAAYEANDKTGVISLDAFSKSRLRVGPPGQKGVDVNVEGLPDVVAEFRGKATVPAIFGGKIPKPGAAPLEHLMRVVDLKLSETQRGKAKPTVWVNGHQILSDLGERLNDGDKLTFGDQIKGRSFVIKSLKW